MDLDTTTPLTRICTVCQQEKVLKDEFGKQSNGKYGRQSACKKCTRRVIDEYRKTPKGKEKHREYAKRHREKPGYNERHRAYRETPKAMRQLYLRGAERRGLPFDLKVEDFENLWGKPCYYCKDPIRTIGLDRLNNEDGYTLSNVVPCCPTCNFMKLKSSPDEFIAKCKKVADNFHTQC